MSYIITRTKDEHDVETATLTVYLEDGSIVTASDSHPAYKAMVIAAMDNALDKVRELHDAVTTVATKFQRLTRQITVRNRCLYFDGDPIDNSLTKQIVRFMEEGLAFDPLVLFMDNLYSNPIKHSRDQAFDWLNARNFTITNDGMIVGYKGVTGSYENDGVPHSSRSGHAFVNGEEINGYVPNPIGATVEMPRSEVMHDPAASCHAGLHVGTFSYAQSWAKPTTIEVLVNPADIVSVPTDAGGEKIRVCRYVVLGPITEERLEALRPDDSAFAVGGDIFDEFDFDEFGFEDLSDLDEGTPEETPQASESTPTRTKHPGKDEFTVMLQRCERRRQSFPKYAAKMSASAGTPWTLTNPDDPKNRLSWTK